MSRNSAPNGATWLLSLLIAAVLTGGVATVVSDHEVKPPIVETVVHDTVVMPASESDVSGTIRTFAADDASAPPLGIPLELDTGTATIEQAIVDGQRSTIEWQGGRPFRLQGTGSIDLGPTHVEMGVGAFFWPIDGARALTPGDYEIDTPVAVGVGGLAHPRDSVTFHADGKTTIETHGGATVLRGIAPLHLEGPGRFRADGDFDIKTRAGTVHRTHLEFGPGPFVFDLRADKTFTATFNGSLTST